MVVAAASDAPKSMLDLEIERDQGDIYREQHTYMAMAVSE